MQARPMYQCFTLLLIASLALFFGLFFGLNYPEIVRHGWPLTRCTVLSSEIATRYCCRTSCQDNSCRSAPSNSPSCGTVMSSIQSNFNPDTCAANSSSCPTQVGSVCDGGYKCCSTCCQTCQSCTQSCSSSGSCSQSCTTYSCNCYCCSSTNDLYCTISCPICYAIDMQIAYSSRDGVEHNVSYRQDFSTDVNKADGFFNSHLANSTAFCYYNPKDESQILYDVKFTAWKWAITAIFGMFPLLVALGFFATFLLVLPAYRLIRRGADDMVDAAREPPRPTWRSRVLGPLKNFRKEKTEAEMEARHVRDGETYENPPPAYNASS